MDAPSEGVSHDAAPTTAAPAESASTASSAGPAAAVNSVAGQTPDNFPFRTTEHQLRPRQPSQSSQVGHSQNGQPSVPNQSPMQPNPEQQDPAAQQRRRVMERDRHNHQSLGPSLNSAVKQVRFGSGFPDTSSASALGWMTSLCSSISDTALESW